MTLCLGFLHLFTSHTFQTEWSSSVSISQMCEWVWLCSGVERVNCWSGLKWATMGHYLAWSQPEEWQHSDQFSSVLHTLLHICTVITKCVKTRQLLTKHTRLQWPQMLSNHSHIRWRKKPDWFNKTSGLKKSAKSRDTS